jgi:hypothetical protein
MNDPMEGEHSESRMFSLISKKLRDYENVRTYIKEAGIASLSETHLSEPMWAYYATNFTGICIEYNLGRLTTALPDETAIVRMQYSEQAPTLRANRSSTEERARQVLSSKTLRWGQEREWRVLHRSSGVLHHRSEKPVVSGVYVGSRMPDDAVEHLIGRMHAKGINVHLMLIDKYNIQFSAKVAPTGIEEARRRKSNTGPRSLEDVRGGTVPS